MRWKHCGDYPVTANMPSSISCRQYAYEQLSSWRHGADVAKSQVEANLAFQAHRVQTRERNGPGNKNNRFPPTIYACHKILHVPGARTYEFHVCSEGCVHWWGYMDDAAQHSQQCQGCDLCQCPHCHSERYQFLGDRCRIKRHAHVEPAQKCWFFFDVFHHIFLDEAWVAGFQNSRDHKLSAFHQKLEDSRLDKSLLEHGFDPKKVCINRPVP
jgi:hypothetical protein